VTRAISIALQAHLDSRVTTYCLALTITPVSGAVFGLTNHDVAITYSGVTYVAARGFDGSALASSEGQGVDNAESNILVAQIGELGITAAQINSGYLDDATFQVLLVNYADLTQGSVIVGGGRVGEIRSMDGLLGAVELRSWSQLAKQKSVIWPTSISCLATFGDATTGCGAPLIWTSTQTITSIGTETDRKIIASALAGATDFYKDGLVQVLTGLNAGKSIEVEAFTVGGIVNLAHPAPFAFANGDTFKIRQDCAKTIAACKAYGQLPNMRALPWLPVADGDALQTPGNVK
jgi:uncharacterized phage protein (TIGR02218 family)